MILVLSAPHVNKIGINTEKKNVSATANFD